MILHQRFFYLLALFFTLSCVPIVDSDKGRLEFKEKNPPPSTAKPLPIEASFESLKMHFIEKSCFGCHSARQDSLPIFETRDQLLDWGEEILYYVKEGCTIGACMPPRRDDGSPVRPLPDQKILNTFEQWLNQQGERINEKH